MNMASMRGITVFRMDEYIYASFSEVDLHELVRADPPPLGWGGVRVPHVEFGNWVSVLSGEQSYDLSQCSKLVSVVCIALQN